MCAARRLSPHGISAPSPPTGGDTRNVEGIRCATSDRSRIRGLWLGMIFVQACWMLGMHYSRQPIHAMARKKITGAQRSVDALARLMPRG